MEGSFGAVAGFEGRYAAAGAGLGCGEVSPILEVMPRTLVASPAKEIREWQRQ